MVHVRGVITVTIPTEDGSFNEIVTTGLRQREIQRKIETFS